MKYLSPSEVLFIHDQAIKQFGGSAGIRDTGLLESALARPQASFDGEDLYPTIFEKAASLMHSLLKNHPFVDGNKRTAYSTVGIFLKKNDYKLENHNKETLAFVMKVENDTLSLLEISSWLEKYSKPTKN